MTRWDIVDLLVGAILILGVAFVFSASPAWAASCGSASWYGEAHQGKLMANGKPFNMRAMTTASNSHPLGSVLRVTSGKRSVVVTVTDRGPAARLHRIIDLSKAAFSVLADPNVGVISVCVERLER